jgi:phytoene dehydrogenase-like protein
MAGAIFLTFLGLRGDLRTLGMTDTNYWAFDGYDFERFFGDGLRNGPGPESVRGCYITSASLKDPDTRTHAPEGYQTLEIMALVPGDFAGWGVTEPATLDGGRYGRTPSYQALKTAIEDNLIARLDRLFPGAAERIAYRESATPVTHTRFTGASGGTGYGLAATPAQFMQNRPGYRGPLPGLFFCGASTRSGHGVVGAMMSGRAAAKAVTKGLPGA